MRGKLYRRIVYLLYPVPNANQLPKCSDVSIWQAWVHELKLPSVDCSLYLTIGARHANAAAGSQGVRRMCTRSGGYDLPMQCVCPWNGCLQVAHCTAYIYIYTHTWPPQVRLGVGVGVGVGGWWSRQTASAIRNACRQQMRTHKDVFLHDGHVWCESGVTPLLPTLLKPME